MLALLSPKNNTGCFQKKKSIIFAEFAIAEKNNHGIDCPRIVGL